MTRGPEAAEIEHVRPGARAFCVWLLACACTSETTPLRDDAGADDAAQVPTDGAARLDASPLPLTCADSDQDGDGHGTHQSCPELDCDDTNPAIHSGAPEACNGLDDDCNGQIDDGLGEGTCGTGACRRSAPFCANGRPGTCVPGPPSQELCNSVDDDCNGMIDDGVEGDSCGIGACARRATCSAGVMGVCVPGDAVAEMCNRMDDDCDGVVDNGFRATSISSSYSVLITHHAGCNGSSQRIGSDCNAAMNRFCASQGCTTSGFGPLENSGDVAAVGCVAAEPSRDVPYSTLAQHHDVCDGTRERIGPNCNAAIHRYCASQGYVSGFGPTEQGPSSAQVVCLRSGAASVLSPGYSTLINHHGGCNGSGAGRIGPDCNAAINRYCRSQGFVTGYGPVENSGDTAIVTCVSL